MMRLLGAVVLGLTQPVGAPAALPSLLAPATSDAAVWRAAAVRLQVELHDIEETGRPAALAAAIGQWRRGVSADARTEAMQTLALAGRWFAAIRSGFPSARWPAGRPPQTYVAVAERELQGAWVELDEAATSGDSPGPALARAWRVRDWLSGRQGETSPFDTLNTDAIEALTAALSPVPGSGQPRGQAAGPVAPPAPPAAGGLRQASLRWIGEGPDLVGPRGATPDGRPDVYLELRFNRRDRLVSMINLSFRDATGQLCCHAWSTADGRFDYLGTGPPGGQIMNRPAFHPAGLGYPPDVLSLVAPGAERFRAGRVTVATIVYVDGSSESAEMPPPL